jgi:hypothetical protein
MQSRIAKSWHFGFSPAMTNHDDGECATWAQHDSARAPEGGEEVNSAAFGRKGRNPKSEISSDPTCFE